ncbi:MAG: ATP-binding cassette domain-containing protein, partial [Hoeflea sp.]|nr:ATP-binding cassette domain-containing protein [Hoeflea sp.]
MSGAAQGSGVAAHTDDVLLSVRDLSVAFHQGGESQLALDRISFDIRRGETVALVGESGSGKSVCALSVLKLLPYPSASHPSGQVLFKGQDLMSAPEAKIRDVRGNDITMIFQEPMTSLNPLQPVEQQIAEILHLHQAIKPDEARRQVLGLLHQVGIREPEKRLASFPHQLSGGQRQRVMIAMALANRPELLIADEPTTALDVTVQAQILELLRDLKQQHGMAMLFITHDLGIVRKFADRVCVMTAGKIVETGATAEIFANPQHAYTKHLLAAEPKGQPPARKPDARDVMRATDIKVWFPVKKGFLRRT